MKLAKKKKSNDVDERAGIMESIRELHILSQQKSEITKREDVLKKQINAYVDGNVKADTLGNRFLRFHDSLGNPRYLKREIRKRVSYDVEKAKERFSDDVLDEVLMTQTVEVLDEDAMEQLVSTGRLTLEDIQCISNVAVSYATCFKEPQEEE